MAKSPVIAPTIQGADEVVIAASLERVWTLVSDSTKLSQWGPPVRGVTLLSPAPEVLGSCRRVDAVMQGKSGHFIERRIEHDEQRRVAYLIEEETFGIFKVISNVGFRIELEEVGPSSTRILWSFFHEPRGLMGRILNTLVIRPSQRKNRLAALAALKRHAEAR